MAAASTYATYAVAAPTRAPTVGPRPNGARTGRRSPSAEGRVMPGPVSEVNAKATPTRVRASSPWLTSLAASESSPGSKIDTMPTSTTVIPSRARIPIATRAGPQVRDGSPPPGSPEPMAGGGGGGTAGGGSPDHEAAGDRRRRGWRL